MLLLFIGYVVSNSLQPMTAAHQASLSFTISQSLLKFMSMELVIPSNHLILCRPRLLLPSIFPSMMVFSNESALGIKCSGASASASDLPMNIQGWFPLELSSLISLLSKGHSRSCFLQHHSLKASVLQCSTFFRVQLLHPHMTTGKTMKVENVSCSVLSDSLWPHGLQHSRLHCPSPSPGICANSFPLSWWYHPTISSSVIPFSSRLFSSSHVQMWELDHKEGWVLKNWCFQIVMLEKTLDSFRLQGDQT